MTEKSSVLQQKCLHLVTTEKTSPESEIVSHIVVETGMLFNFTECGKSSE